MDATRIYRIRVSTLYPLYLQKAGRKGRTQAEVDAVIFWLTGYDAATLQEQIDGPNDLESFFAQAPQINPNASKITGVICGHRVEKIEDRLTRQIRYLDKLVDELAKGRPMEKILRK